MARGICRAPVPRRVSWPPPTEQPWGTVAAGARGRGRSLGTQGCSSSEGTRPDRRHRRSSRQELQPQEGCCKITSAASALRLPPGAVNNPTASPCPRHSPEHRGDVWLRSAPLESPRSPGDRGLEDGPGPLQITRGEKSWSWSPAGKNHARKNPVGLRMGLAGTGPGRARAAREQLLKSIPVLSLPWLPQGPPPHLDEPGVHSLGNLQPAGPEEHKGGAAGAVLLGRSLTRSGSHRRAYWCHL